MKQQIKKYWLRISNLFKNRYLDIYKLNQLNKRGIGVYTPSLFYNLIEHKRVIKEKNIRQGFLIFFNLPIYNKEVLK